ncbi:MAG: Rieske 2Fe-2S domain-containing protein [Phycisphaerales bacterium]|nr:MAG: Rieske 2Fe-2S domain-containing protein [Phycisphaerales bacterium]
MPVRTCVVGVILVLLWVPSARGADESKATCLTCHPAQKDRVVASVHQALECRECHGGDESYAVPPQHLEQFARARGGPTPTFEHGASFTGKPRRKDLPAVCGGCHADVERMNPFGLRTDQLARYKVSGHGKALYGREDERVAVCTDCHGPPHAVLAADHPQSQTHPRNVPGTCGVCHEDRTLMNEYDLPVEVVSEYRQSVHGRLLLEQEDTGAPTCNTCHGNHSATPPGFATVGAVCGRCHAQEADLFASSAHGGLEDHGGCVACHGGGAERHFHLIERITTPVDVLTARYARLLATEPDPTPEQVAAAIDHDPRRIMTQALGVCTACHDALDEDENLPRLFALLDEIAGAELRYVQTAWRLDEVGRGVLLVENARFRFGDAKTHLIALAPLQHTLDQSLVTEKVSQIDDICDEVDGELDALEAGLRMRYWLLIPIWVVALCFCGFLYLKFRALKAAWVRPVDAATSAPTSADEPPTRRAFFNWVIGASSAAVGVAMGLPAVLYLWPAAKGGGSANVEVPGAANLPPGRSTMIQVEGKPVIVVRQPSGFRAFSAACTHLGCLVKWDADKGEFLCPCHAAVFDKDGGVVSGPPPSPLPEYSVKEVGDQVFVSAS